MSYLVPAARGYQGENPILLWTCDDDTIGVVPSLVVPHLRPVSACGSGGSGWWCCPRAAAKEVHLVCVGREVQKTHGRWRS